jgi:peroxiredoxin
VAELRAQAKSFEAAGAKVVLVYPGATKELKERAKEFLKEDTLPAPLMLVVDPDYTFVNAYGLRWNEPQETAYPSTFVIDKKNKVVFSTVSKKHGGRSKVKDVLAALPKS